MNLHFLAWLLIAGLVPGAALAQKSLFGIARQVTGSMSIDPSLSPDGKHMVYIRVIGDFEQLFMANVDGSESRQITHDPYDHEDPAWSHDGAKIAFVSFADGGQVISVMSPDGSAVETLTPKNVHAIHPAWMPDDGALLYCTTDDLDPPRKNAADIYRMDLAMRHVTRLTSEGINTYPKPSRDGTRIAFRKIVGELNSEVFVADADGSNARNLTNNPAYDGWPAWSPDGSSIAFASNRQGNQRIYVMNADGKNIRPVVHKEGRATAPAWSPDGSAIYFPVCTSVDGVVGCEIFMSIIKPPVP